MDLIPVDSSNLAAVRYNPFSSVLTIVFHGNRVYRYFRVPFAVYRGLMRAESHGRYFHACIRHRYPYRRVR